MGMAAPIELYFYPTANPKKIAILLEETALPYVLRFVDIGRGRQFDPAFLAISPNNKVPAITDPEGPDGKPISMFESGAILQYLGDKTGLFYPEDRRARTNINPMAVLAGWKPRPHVRASSSFCFFCRDEVAL